MNHRILPFLLALIAGAALLTACAGAQNPEAQEAVNRVHPIGEGNYYDPDAESVTEEDGTNAATEPSSVPPTTVKPKTKKTQATTAPTTVPATTVPSTTYPNVPKDNMTPSHINPSLGSIQNNVLEQMQAAALKNIALSKTAVTVEVGEKESLELKFTPTDAPRKTCKVTTNNKNATALFVDKKLVITGKAAGACTVTVTSFNGITATCEVTIKAKEAPATSPAASDAAPVEAATQADETSPDDNKEE